MSTPTILVIGGTGQQGGATINALLQQGGFTIRTISRTPDSPSAKRLSEQGVQVLNGDLTDKSSLVAAFQAVDVVYFMTDNKGTQGAAGEVIHGKSILEAAHEVGVKRVVFSSVQSADRTANVGGVPHFESKAEVEKLIKGSGLQWTILRPAAFMEFIPLSGAGRYMTLGILGATLGQKKVQFISVEDIGIVAARAIAEPEQFSGKTVDLAGDELSTEEIQDVFKKVTGQSAGKAPLPGFLAKIMLSCMSYDLKQMFRVSHPHVSPLHVLICLLQFFEEVGYNTDISEVKKIHPGVLTFEEYLRKRTKT
jgi:uncharacterized protein YbjT (DUF2867 family)